MQKLAAALSALCFLAGCGQIGQEDSGASQQAVDESAGGMALPQGLKPGSNEMLRAPVSADPDLEVIVSDVIIPPNSEVPRHYHPGEEFVYVIEGSALHVEEGKADRLIASGEAMVISPEVVHAPRGGPDGARAIVFRVHLKGQPERIPATGK